MNPYDYSSSYSYPGWPAMVPSTSLMTLPMAGLGATSASALGGARLVGDNEITVPGRVYTYRSFSTVAINPDREVDITIPHGAGYYGGWAASLLAGPAAPVIVGVRLGFAAAGDNAWEAADKLGWRVAAPRGHASFWQNATREVTPEGRQGYRTSLNITPTAQGVKGGALKWAARNILSFMAGSNSPDDVSRISPGWLYARDVNEDSAGLLRRASEAVIGRERTHTAVELGTTAEAAVLGSTAEREAAAKASRDRMLIAHIGFGLAIVLGIFLSTRKGSAKLEGRAARVTGGGVKLATVIGTKGLVSNRRRRRNTAPKMGPYGIKFALERVSLDRGGYDRRGRYWGIGAPLFAYDAVDPDEHDWRHHRLDGHLRARDREDAKAQLRKKYPGARFMR